MLTPQPSAPRTAAIATIFKVFGMTPDDAWTRDLLHTRRTLHHYITGTDASFVMRALRPWAKRRETIINILKHLIWIDRESNLLSSSHGGRTDRGTTEKVI